MGCGPVEWSVETVDEMTEPTPVGWISRRFEKFDFAATTYEISVLEFLNYSAGNLNCSDKNFQTNLPLRSESRVFILLF